MAKKCAPSREGQSISCFTKPELVKMANALNSESSKRVARTTGNKKQIWDSIRKALSHRCNTEVCWMDQDFAKSLKGLERKAFRPKMPGTWKRNPNTWLSTTDINVVMKQYEDLYPDFLFIGPVPADCPNGFSCQLTNFDINKLCRNGIKRVGVVYNLDKSWQPGSHWVAVFIDCAKHKDITYYDSYGIEPPELIGGFIDSVKNSSKIPLKYDHNKVRHQYGNSECGVYSMNYIIQRLKGKSMKQAVNKKIPDKTMLQMRQYLYRNSDE